jgi:L-idonate 5-dehydrogenase
MPMPHIDGAFRQQLVAEAAQCVPLAGDVPPGHGAVAEPLSVVLHALRQAGGVADKRVLVTGCGPIGLLCAMAARADGAREVVVTDLVDPALDRARAADVDRAVNVTAEAGWREAYAADKGHFDVGFEATGVSAGITDQLACLRPGGKLVQLGLGGDITLPIGALVTREVEWIGAFRFHEEFATAVDWINSGRLPLDNLITHRFALNAFADAFEKAADRRDAMKVLIDFTA